jgi:hypothetical protein
MRRLRFRSVVPLPLLSAFWVVACGSSGGGHAGSSNGASGSAGSSSGSLTSSGGNPASSGGNASGGGQGSSGSAGGTPVIPFGGAGGGSQNNLITTGISPLSCGDSSAFNGTTVMPVGGDNLTCFFSAAVSDTLPLAFIEQDEEIIGGKDLIHARLTLNPAFVDNTYGSTAIGWGGTSATTGMAMGMGMGMDMGMPMGHGHSFWDLIDSDHAEFDFKDSAGTIVLSFDLDYCSSDANSPSGFACLGVSGGDGGMLVGSASSVVYYNSSLARDLTACGYSSYTTNSPATDASYTPNPAAPEWDYRVVYDVWVLKSALPSGWTVSVPYVHASPSKLSDTYTVKSAPCPPLGCVGELCTTGSGCLGALCDAGTTYGDGGCVGEGCTSGGGCVGLLCDSGTTIECVGEGCNAGGGCIGSLCDSGTTTECVGEGCNDGGSSWCSSDGAACTDNSACCSGYCAPEGVCQEAM